MTQNESNIPWGVSEETERLIVRHLDGEITVVQQARLDQMLAASEEARALLAEYRKMELTAMAAMQCDLAAAGSHHAGLSTPRTDDSIHRRPMRRFIAMAATFATAASIALAIFLNRGPRGPEVAVDPSLVESHRANVVELSSLADSTFSNGAVPRIQKLPPGVHVGSAMPVDLAEYREVDYQPRNRFGNVYRDLLGIRGSNPNRIYILEREAQKTNAVLVSGDF